MRVSFKFWRLCIIENTLYENPCFKGLRTSCYFDGKGYRHIYKKLYWMKNTIINNKGE